MNFRSKIFILSGIYALIGILISNKLIYKYNYGEMGISVLPINLFWIVIFSLAVLVFLISVLTTYLLARQSKTPVPFKKRFNLLIPSFVGFIVIFLMIDRDYFDLIVPVALILYGLVLFNLNRFVTSRLVYFALAAVILGCISLFVRGYDYVFLLLGFSVFPILFGLVLLKKAVPHTPST